MMRLFKRLERWIPWMLLVGLFAILCYFMHRRIDYLLNSDLSSELILARTLAGERALLTKSWFYSTEIRVLNTQLVFTPAFYFFKDWHQVRVFSSILIWLILLASYYYLCTQIGCKKYFALSAIPLILPLSDSYFSFVLKDVCYAPYIVVSFLTVGLLFQYVKCRSRWRGALLSVAGVLAVFAGTNGPRQLILLYLPLLLAALLYAWTRPKAATLAPDKARGGAGFTVAAAVLFTCAAIGYVLNVTLLAQNYHFMSYGDIQFQAFDLARFLDVLNGLLYAFGYSVGKVFSKALLYNIVSFALCIALIYSVVRGLRRSAEISERNRFLSLFFTCAFAVLVLLNSFSDFTYYRHYILPVSVFAYPIITMNLVEIRWSKRVKQAICAGLAAVFLLVGAARYRTLVMQDDTKQYRSIVQCLQERGYAQGYSTFWHANVLTELSDGALDVYSWCDGPNRLRGVKDVNQIYAWLQLTAHRSTPPAGPVFMLLTGEELEACRWRAQLQDDAKVYEKDGFVIYGYDSYEKMLSALSKISIQFGDGQNLTNGWDERGVRHLAPGGASAGPLVTLYPGSYTVTVTGSGLDKAAVYVTSDANREKTAPTMTDCTAERAVFYLRTEETLIDFAVIVENPSGEAVSIEQISIEPGAE